MPQTLNGFCKWITKDTLGNSVGIFRAAISNWNFTDDTGAAGTYPLFTTTGDIYIQQLYGACKIGVTSGGAPTMEVGIAGNTACLIAQTVSTNILQYNLWQDATPEVNPGIIILLQRSWLAQNGVTINLTLAGVAVTAGDIDFYCNYIPLSPDASLSAV
jgi:hypothetical protein